MSVVHEIFDMIGYHHSEVSKNILEYVNEKAESEIFQQDIKQ